MTLGALSSLSQAAFSLLVYLVVSAAGCSSCALQESLAPGAWRENLAQHFSLEMGKLRPEQKQLERQAVHQDQAWVLPAVEAASGNGLFDASTGGRSHFLGTRGLPDLQISWHHGVGQVESKGLF